MNLAALIAMHLIAIEPASLDAAARIERMKSGQPLIRTVDSAAMMRARDAGPSIAARVLACYHPSATLTGWRRLGPWNQAWEEGASHSAAYRIDYRGISGTAYQITVAVAGRLGDVNIHEAWARGYVLSDNATIPARRECELESRQPLQL